MSDFDLFEILHPDFSKAFFDFMIEHNVNFKNSELSGNENRKTIDLAKEFIEKCISNTKRILLINKEDREAQRFETTFQQVWGESICLSEIHEHLISEVAMQSTNIVLSDDDSNIKEYVLTKLLGNAIRTYQEIILLMKNGYPYGAISLTRNLFELSIITRFIAEESDEVSIAYYRSSNAEVDHNDRYAWARPSGKFSKKERITIQRLRELSKFDDERFKDLYTIYCNFAHSAPQIVNNDVDTNSPNIYAGPKVNGIDAPGTNAAAFICDILLKVKGQNATQDINFKILFCLVWEEYTSESYKRAAEKLDRIIGGKATTQNVRI